MKRVRHVLYVTALLAALLGGGSASCFDPQHASDVDALGPERKGVNPGPNHRPGQNCLTCHGGNGPGSPDFSIAGTIYSAVGIQEPLSDVTVVLVDANQSTRSATSNEVGSFYIATASWSPTFPVTVQLRDSRADVGGVKAMVTPIGREGGCAFCHYGAVDEPTHMPPVYLRQKAL